MGFGDGVVEVRSNPIPGFGYSLEDRLVEEIVCRGLDLKDNFTLSVVWLSLIHI